MILSQFDYITPTTVESAVSALQQPGTVAIAGGHHLLTLLKRREVAVRTLVDLRGLTDLRGICSDVQGGLRVGALTTLTDLLTHPAVRSNGSLGALDDALSVLGDRQSRNRVTIGGQLACGRTGNDLIAALLVLDATVSVTGPTGDRTVPITQLSAGGPSPALAPGELITTIVLSSARTGSGYARMTNHATLEAICGVAVSLQCRADDRVEDCQIAAVGATAQPTRMAAMQKAVIGTDGRTPPPAPATTDFLNDRLASHEYRQHMTGVLAGRALRLARARAHTATSVA